MVFGGAGLTHWVPAPPDGMHQVDRMLHVLERVGVPPAGAQLRLNLPEKAGEPYALLLPGASCSSRRYPRFARVAELLSEAGLRTVVAGSAREADLVEEAGGGVTDLDVPGLAALVAGSAVVVCNNSGGAHLASALGRPVVVLFAGTEEVGQYAPRFTPATVLTVPTPCAPCRQLRCPYAQECLDVPPEEVARAALRLVAGRVPTVR